MSNWIIKHTLIIFVLIFSYSCTDLLINNEHKYNSIRLKGGGWIEFQSVDVADILNGDFSFQIWISADSESSNEAKALFCILDNTNAIHFALYRNTSNNNSVDLYLNGALTQTITNDAIDWSSPGFDLFTITANSQTNQINIYINDENVYNSNFDFNVTEKLVVGARVDDSQTNANNFWYGYIEEMRLWSSELTSDKVNFHFNNPTKLVSANGCSDSSYATEDECEDNNAQWSAGTYLDDTINTLSGLWRFNYEDPIANISDEGCQELNLGNGASGNIECSDINGSVYTLPGYKVEFSNFGL